MIVLLLLVEGMVRCLFYLIYLLLLTPLIFCILGKYVGIYGNALKLIQSYFSHRSQRVQLDNDFYFANIICGVHQDSVLGPLFFLECIACERYFDVS